MRETISCHDFSTVYLIITCCLDFLHLFQSVTRIRVSKTLVTKIMVEESGKILFIIALLKVSQSTFAWGKVFALYFPVPDGI